MVLVEVDTFFGWFSTFELVDDECGEESGSVFAAFEEAEEVGGSEEVSFGSLRAGVSVGGFAGSVAGKVVERGGK